MPDLVVSEAVIGDVNNIVALHQAAFDGFFLTRLGPQFLKSYYAGVCSLPEGACYVIRDHDAGKLLGFVAGSAAPGAFYRRLLIARWYHFAIPAVKFVLRNPASIKRVLRAFSHPKRSETRDNTASIFSIAVDPAAQGLGVGKQLVAKFAIAMREKGMKAVRLETDSENNSAANKFYQSLGFVCLRQIAGAGGRKMNDYVLDLQTWSTPSSVSHRVTSQL